MLNKKVGVGIGFLIVFGGILAIGIIFGDTKVSLAQNPLESYEINTECELVDLLLENNMSFQKYHEEFEQQLPTEWNNWKSYLEESEASILKNYESKTIQQVLAEETEQRIKLTQFYLKMPMEYFSINPSLENKVITHLYAYPTSFLGFQERDPVCFEKLNEKYQKEVEV